MTFHTFTAFPDCSAFFSRARNSVEFGWGMKIGNVFLLLFAAECSGGSRHYQKKIHQSIQRLEGSNSNSAHDSNESEGERHQRHYQRYEFAYEITTAVTSMVPSKLDLARSDMPYFAQPIDNLTVAVGREAVFPCVINNLTKYKVAWLREETHSLLSIHDKVITRNYRISLIEAADKHWTLKISAVQESDTGWYMCQINTDPMLFQKAYLQVVVPPDIIDEESSSAVDIREGENATLICRARGNPTPSIIWRREDGAEIVTNNIHRANSVEGEILFIQKATRLHMGRYLCIASNGVPPMVSKRVSVNVHFPPRVLVPHQLIGIMQGQEAVLTCHAEVYPKAITYWTTDRGEVISVGGRFTTLVTESDYKISMVLRINPVKVGDFRKYRCFIRNSLGDAEGSILLQEISAVNVEMKTKEILPTTEMTARSEQKTDTIIKSYSGETSSLARTKEFLEVSLRNDDSCCLVCLENLNRNDAIWSCGCCFESLHLSCVQRWARDSINHQRDLAIDRFGESAKVDLKAFKWSCPKCRSDYAYAEIPELYYCFCKKVVDPKFDPWLVPHACSNICEKGLLPQCGHRCLLPCHPGPCPPCPKTVNAKCYCGGSPARTLRCHAKTWSCGKPCGRILNCRQHYCEAPCHEGPCSPCGKRSIQRCQCRRKAAERPCYEPEWKCDTPCGKPYSCGSHNCEVVCHDGSCGDCPLSLIRTCPCGKSSYQLPCTAPTPTCGDTCGKQLACGRHTCAERCHRGPCGTCLQMAVKKCRCGNKQKELPCYKDFTCETKCKRMKDCRRHPCNKKCCVGDCPPCEQICGRVLGCGNHKCVARCHQGRCYPCHEKIELRCACGSSVISVPCGREKVTKPPRCSKLCQIPSDCHHPERRKHLCHFGKCSPCKQDCGLKLPNCSHICMTPCHDNVLVKVEAEGTKKRAGPWEKQKEPVFQTRKLPCPPCMVPIPVTCLGGHETKEWPCHKSEPSSCLRPCGRVLNCTNHLCTKSCHLVENAEADGKAGTNCLQCEEPCLKPRPDKCNHLCPRPCHHGDCPSCSQTVKVRCHCALNWAYYKCGEWTKGSEEKREELKSCKDQCPKLMSCGHRCTKLCHSGPCASSTECKKKLKVYCRCKRLKKDVVCSQAQLSDGKLGCDEMCMERMSNSEKERLKLEACRKDEEERLKQQELDNFSKKMNHKKKRRERSLAEQPEVPQGFWEHRTKLWITSLFIGIVSIGVFVLCAGTWELK